MIHLIVAMSQNGVIGKDGDMPWGRSIPSDLKRFRTLTLGHTVIVGRKTHESILRSLGKPMPGRHTIVLSRDRGYQPTDGILAHSLEEAFTIASKEVFVAGGAEVYSAALHYVDRLHVTVVNHVFEGDVTFPIVRGNWKTVQAEAGLPSVNDKYSYHYFEFTRV